MWTEERVSNLIKWLGEGLSSTQVAERLGNGFTRNSVIGKANRLGIKSVAAQNFREAAFQAKMQRARERAQRELKRRETAEAREAARRVQKPRKRVEGETDLQAIIAIPTNNYLHQKAGSCRWPHGEVCCHRALPMKSYCAEHEAKSRS